MPTAAGHSAAKPKRPALRYHGGKWMLAPWIISHFPPPGPGGHRIYTEVYGGAASVLLRKPRSYSEVYNDLWSTVADVFRVLSTPYMARELERRLRHTSYSRIEFERVTTATLAREWDPVERVRLTMLRSFAGFGSAATNGDHLTGFRANANRSGTTPAHDWMNFPGNIQALQERLMGVVIECRPALEVLHQHDQEDALHYVDPPYMHSTRNMQRGNAAYAREMTKADHVELLGHLVRLQGMVVLSSYPNALYQVLARFGWTCIKKSAYADGARERTEVLWINPAAMHARTRMGPLFDASLE